MKIFWLLAIILFISDLRAFSWPKDSVNENKELKKIFFSFRSSLSTTYIIQENFNQNNLRDFLFLSDVDYYYKITREKFIQSYHCKAGLGYMMYPDSMWYKYTDGWKLNILLNENESKNITHSYAFDISSQFLHSYKYGVDIYEKQLKEWRGGFLNPATINFSYNISMNLWSDSNVMLGLSSVRIAARPRYEGVIEPKDLVAKTPHSFILAIYGMSAQVNIYSQKITESLFCDNSSGFFVNGINKSQMNFDFQNTFIYKFLKYMQLRFDTHIIYDPLVSYHLQYDQEFLIGVFIEKRK